METTPQDTQHDSYSHTRHKNDSYSYTSQLLVRPIYLFMDGVPRLTFKRKDMAPDRGLVICAFNGSTKYVQNLFSVLS
jgi:hypothetical protein